jgi:hypothetical protein
MMRRILRSKGTEAGMLRFLWWVGGAKDVANQGDADSRGKSTGTRSTVGAVGTVGSAASLVAQAKAYRAQ